MPLLAAPPAATHAESSSSKSKGKGAPPPSIVRTPIPEGPGPFALFIDHAGNVARAVPALGAQLAAIPGLLDQSARGGRGTVASCLLLGLVAVVAVLRPRRCCAGLGAVSPSPCRRAPSRSRACDR